MSVQARAAVKQEVAAAVGAKVVVKESGSVSLRGTVRKVNEDRFDVKVGVWVCARRGGWRG